MANHRRNDTTISNRGATPNDIGGATKRNQCLTNEPDQQCQVSNRADDPGLGGDMHIIVMCMAARDIPLANGEGWVGRGIIPWSNTREGICEEHAPARLLLRHTLNDREILARNRYPTCIEET